jgi:hypothetical protein
METLASFNQILTIARKGWPLALKPVAQWHGILCHLIQNFSSTVLQTLGTVTCTTLKLPETCTR